MPIPFSPDFQNWNKLLLTYLRCKLDSPIFPLHKHWFNNIIWSLKFRFRELRAFIRFSSRTKNVPMCLLGLHPVSPLYPFFFVFLRYQEYLSTSANVLKMTTINSVVWMKKIIICCEWKSGAFKMRPSYLVWQERMSKRLPPPILI